jgi:hypothetical protein
MGCALAKVTLELDSEEAGFLDDILSWWLDGYEDAKEQTISDPGIGNFEDLQTLAHSLTTQQAMVVAMRYKLRDVAHE